MKKKIKKIASKAKSRPAAKGKTGKKQPSLKGYKPCRDCRPDQPPKTIRQGLHYVTSKTSVIYHYSTCPQIKRIPRSHKINLGPYVVPEGVELPEARKKRKKIDFSPVHKLMTIFFILSITVILILNQKGMLSAENPVHMGIILAIIGIYSVYILIGVQRSIVRRHNLHKKEVKALFRLKKAAEEEDKSYATEIDKVYAAINQAESLPIDEIAQTLKISKKQAEEWAKILESHDLVEIKYPLIGDMLVCKKKLKDTESKQKE